MLKAGELSTFVMPRYYHQFIPTLALVERNHWMLAVDRGEAVNRFIQELPEEFPVQEEPAEDLWKNPSGRSDFSGCPDRDEAMRNQILRLFQQCLSGINSIKFREGKEIRGLVEIHEISDSSVLKNNIYSLITDLLSLAQRTRDKVTPFLVIQLDDTDFQTRRCYEIMEDIRKYLTIPNVVILMATDLNMLRVAMTQQSIGDFQNGLLHNLINSDKLYRTVNKYLDKLIPPNHAVYLPHLDEVIREQNASLRISYLAKNELGVEIDLLAVADPSQIPYDFPFQERIFRYIYLKTRIAFVPQSGRAHSILPTTLRGFSQFFATISSMQDVTQIAKPDDTEDVIPITEYSDPAKLIELVQSQLDTLDKNLSLFENYRRQGPGQRRQATEGVGVSGRPDPDDPLPRAAPRGLLLSAAGEAGGLGALLQQKRIFRSL